MCSAERTAQVTQFTRLRQADQIVDGVVRYEVDRDRSLDFTQQTVASWVNIALMVGKLNVPALSMWTHGLGEGHSVKVPLCSLVQSSLYRFCGPMLS